jgi:hypothetical protein
MLKRYSEFISFPIELWTEKTEYQTVPDPDAEVAEGEEPKTKSVPKTSKVWEKVNVAKPLWMRPPKEVQENEYDEFYKTTFRAYDTPDAHVHFSLEGQVEFRALLYLPSSVPWELSQDMFNDKVGHWRSRGRGDLGEVAGGQREMGGGGAGRGEARGPTGGGREPCGRRGCPAPTQAGVGSRSRGSLTPAMPAQPSYLCKLIATSRATVCPGPPHSLSIPSHVTRMKLLLPAAHPPSLHPLPLR